VIDLSGLSCVDSMITLTQGEIVLPVNATLNGPADRTLTLTSAGSRILKSISSDTPAYLSVANLTLSGGRVYTVGDFADGGCVFAAGAVNLTHSTVQDCAVHASNAMARGGAIYAQSVQLTASRVTNSSANATGSYQLVRGGGIYAASLSCVDSTLSDNVAAADAETMLAEGGGAMLIGGNVQLNRCTISDNRADNGGGIKHQTGYSNTTLIENSTISGNTARNSAGGIEVFCSKCTPALLQVLNSTIAFNTATSAYGAGFYTNANVDAQSTIIAGNTSLSGGFGDLFAAGMSGADNLIQSTNVTPDAGVITVTADPQLLPLADNGGATFTHALADGSPALQAGNNVALLSTDQRGAGFSRTLNGMVDIGAWQTQDAGTQKTQQDGIFGGKFD
jgi:Right handed beta helix region